MRATIVLLAVALLAALAAAETVGARPVALSRDRAVSSQPRFVAVVTGANRNPQAGAPWPFTVRAVDGAGRAISGTAIVRVVVRGRIVDTVGWFGFKGVLHRTYRWSPILRGSSALFEAKVVGPGGARTVSYAVHVR